MSLLEMDELRLLMEMAIASDIRQMRASRRKSPKLLAKLEFYCNTRNRMARFRRGDHNAD